MNVLFCMSNDNKCCIYQVKKKGKRKVIGVLDIYGFEIFKVQTVKHCQSTVYKYMCV